MVNIGENGFLSKKHKKTGILDFQTHPIFVSGNLTLRHGELCR